MKKVFLFNGQGAQYYHMGQKLYERNENFRIHMDMLDKETNSILGYSILEIIMDKNKKINMPFDDLVDSNLGIFFIQYSLCRLVLEMGIVPDALVGASFGELACLAIANVISVNESIKVIISQSGFLQSNNGLGYSLSVSNDPKETFLNTGSYLVGGVFSKGNYLAITKEKMGIETLLNINEAKEIKVRQSLVQLPFHSEYIDMLRQGYMDRLSKQAFNFLQPKYKIFSAGTAGELKEFSKENFWLMIRNPISFKQTIEHVENDQDNIFIDFGPTSILANATQDTLDSSSRSKVFSLMGPFINTEKNLDGLKTQILID